MSAYPSAPPSDEGTRGRSDELYETYLHVCSDYGLRVWDHCEAIFSKYSENHSPQEKKACIGELEAMLYQASQGNYSRRRTWSQWAVDLLTILVPVGVGVLLHEQRFSWTRDPPSS